MRIKPTFAAILFWEFLQNLPPALGFFLGYSFLDTDISLGIGLPVGGALIGALVIRYTESYIEPGSTETWMNTVINALFFASGSVILVLYFDNRWGGWLVDISLGALAGILLSLSQAKAAGSRLYPPHLVAMMVALAAALPGTRLLLLHLPPIPAALGLCLGVSWLIAFIEYLPEKTSNS